MKHLVQFSTGAASAEVAWRVIQQHGAPNVVLLTADTKVEDGDNWRFAEDVVAWMATMSPPRCEWVKLADGRTPMQVGRDERCVPSNRMAVCSKILKRKLLDRYRAEHFDPADAVVYLGYDWTELHRVKAAQGHWAPWTVLCPLTEPPHLWKGDILDRWRARGGELLLRVNRPRYLEWEAEEEASRKLLGKDVAILRDRTGGTTRALPLAAFRERIERQPALFDAADWGACGCDMAVSGA